MLVRILQGQQEIARNHIPWGAGVVGNTPMAMGFSLGGPGDCPRHAPGHRKNAFLPQAGFALEHPRGLQWQDRTGTTPGGHLPSTKEPWWREPTWDLRWFSSWGGALPQTGEQSDVCPTPLCVSSKSYLLITQRTQLKHPKGKKLYFWNEHRALYNLCWLYQQLGGSCFNHGTRSHVCLSQGSKSFCCGDTSLTGSMEIAGWATP